MPDTHLILPIKLQSSPKHRGPSTSKLLGALLEACAQRIDVNGRIYSINLYETPEFAFKALGLNTENPWHASYQAAQIAKEEIDQSPWKLVPTREHEANDSHVWLTITSIDVVCRPDLLLRETFQFPDFLYAIQNRLFTKEMEKSLKTFVDAMPASVGTYKDPIDALLLQIAMEELKNDIATNLQRLPNDKVIAVDDRGNYLKSPFGVDPVEAAISQENRYSLADALNEHNVDYIDQLESQVEEEQIECFNEIEEDFLEVFASLNATAPEVKEEIREYIREIISYKGCVNLIPEGSCAVDAMPQVDGENMYIEFDGITSTALNAIQNNAYWGMLDLLHVDMKSWADYLLDVEGQQKANWNIDLKTLVDGFLETQVPGVYGYSTGGQHATLAGMAHAVKCSLFQLNPTHDTAISLRRPVGASGDIVYTDQQLIDGAINDSHSYVFNVALEVLVSQAKELDKQWLLDNGVDESRLQLNYTSKENVNLALYPQLAKSPNYSEWIARLSEGIAGDYEWTNPPHLTSKNPLLTPKKLAKVLNNAGYDGSVVIAFQMELDELKDLSDGLAFPEPHEVEVSNAYFHIQSFTNGAGDGMELDHDFTFACSDLQTRKMALLNDANKRYGITATFGEFLAANSSVRIQKIPATELTPEKQPSTAAVTLPSL